MAIVVGIFWTEERSERAIKMREDGLSIAKIAEKMNMSIGAIHGFFRRYKDDNNFFRAEVIRKRREEGKRKRIEGNKKAYEKRKKEGVIYLAKHESDLIGRVDDKPAPLDLAKTLLWGRFTEKNGAYYLDGRPAKLNDIMRAANIIQVSNGNPQITNNPAWVV